MASFQPIYRAYCFASGGLSRNADGTVDLAGSTFLTPTAAADHSDELKVATALGVTGFQPYLDIPRGRRGRVDFLTKRTDVGRLTLAVLDKRLTPTQNAQRWQTSYVGDAEGRRQLEGKEWYVEESTDGGSSWSAFFLGRCQGVRTSSRVWAVIELRDMASELSVETFRGAPLVSYANGASLLPPGLVFDYGPFDTTPLVPADVSAGGGTVGGVTTADILIVDEDALGLSSADRNLTIVTRDLQEAAGQRASSIGSPIPSPSLPRTLDGVVAHVRLVGGARDGETGLMYLRPFIIGSTSTPGPVGTSISGYLRTEKRDQHFYLRAIAVEAVDSAFAVGNWGTTTVEFAIISDGDPTPRRPILVDDVHPVQLWADILDGQFGPFDRDRTVRFTTPKDETAFASLIADDSFPLFRGIIEAPAFADEWIEKHILQPYNLAFYRDGDGRVVPVDLRSRNAAGAPTIDADDVVTNGEPTSSTDLSSAVTDVSITHYVEVAIAREEYSAREEVYPDIPSFGLLTGEAVYRVLNIGNPDVPPQKTIEIDALGFRVSDLEELEQGVQKAIFLRGRFDELVAQLRIPYGAGSAILFVPCRRNATTDAITQGSLAIVDVDEIMDPTTNRRGGPRLGRCLERIESGPTIGFAFLDLGVNVTALTPTLGTISALTGEDDRSVEVEVTALNAASDPVVIDVAVTEQSVGTRPAEGSPLWFRAGGTDAIADVIVRDLPANMRVWARGRSEPNPELGGSLLPSIWVFPSNSFVDLAGIDAPTGLAIEDVGGSYVVATFTAGDDAYPTEVWLDGIRRKRLAAGSTRFELRGITPGTTYNSPGLQVRHVNEITGGVSAFATVTFVALGTATVAPAYDAAVLIVGESG